MRRYASYMDMQVSAVNKDPLNHDNEEEAGAPQSLAILEYLVLDRAGGS